MPIRSRRVASSTAVFLLCSGVLAGCSSSSNSVVTVTNVAALSTAGGKSTARSEVQTAILVAALSTGNAIPGGPSPAAVARKLFMSLRAPAVSGTSSGACSAGTKQSATTNADATVTTVTDMYYDAACATLAEEYSVTLNAPGSASSLGTGMLTTYSSAGAVTSSQALTINASLSSGQETLTVKDAVAQTIGGGTVSEFDSTCVGTPSSTVPNCSYAHVGTIASTEYAESVATSTTAGTTGGNATAQITASFYVSGTLSTSLTGTTWSISDGTAFTSASGSYGYISSGSNGTVALSDGLYTFVETATNASGALTVSITQTTSPTASNVPIGTATIDRFGNGTITYADGTSDPVHGGFVGV